MTVGRRTFLRLAGASAVGAVAAACSPSPSTPSAVTSNEPAPVVAPSPSGLPAGAPNWDALRDKLSGGLLRPGNAEFAGAKRVFNTLFDGRNPVAIAKCSTPADVQSTVVAAAGRVTIAARSGGHSYAGYSLPEGGLVIDLSALSSIDFQGDQVVIGAGAKLKDVYAALGQAGRCLPAGTCPTVGIAGLTLGGGIGVLTRKYGLTCDHLASALIVTPDGKLRTASASSEPDLFWALRGGGGGNFGVVTSFTFDTQPAPNLTVFALRFSPGAANGVLDAWQRWVQSAPPELWTNLVLSGGSPVQIRVGGCFVGSPGELAPVLNGFVADTGAATTSRTVRAMGYLPAMNYFSGSSNRQGWVASSRMITAPVPAEKVTGLMDGRTGMDLLIDSLGGAVSGPAKTDTAFWHRDALASVQIYAPATTTNEDKAAKSVGEVAAGLAAAGAGGGYVNYIDPSLPDWKAAYYGDNAKRLQQVAQKYDPYNVFRFGQGVQA
ncbi:MAG TPA: FAD-binding oxidoreductase [Amycolatopsis sp.]|nr:FAD-binding oxidoreductase [Amycolatopsis sp.]